MSQLLTTKEVSKFLNINEKMVYSLVSDKGLPASKITGKWLFPKNLVEQWIETHTTNYPQTVESPSVSPSVLIITGSNDLLLDKVITFFNVQFPKNIAVFGNLGSMGGLQALRQNACHIASSHLLQEDDDDYNFDFANQELNRMPAIVNFCRREQGILVKKRQSCRHQNNFRPRPTGIEHRQSAAGNRHAIAVGSGVEKSERPRRKN